LIRNLNIKLSKLFNFQFKETVGQTVMKKSDIPAIGHNVPADFDETEYLLLNFDIENSDLTPSEHYELFGINEGRLYKSGEIVTGLKSNNPAFKTCLLVINDLTLTGSPMLALNLVKYLSNQMNVITLSFTNSGKLLESFLKYSEKMFLFNTNPENFEIVELNIRKILNLRNIDYAIANSSVTRHVLPALKKLGIPAISLIHEFASYAPEGAVKDSIKNSSIAVFSANATKNDAIEFLKMDETVDFPVIYQGINDHSEISKNKTEVELERRRIDAEFDSDKFIVLGIGSIIMTKGADLFVSLAQTIEKKYPNKFKFVWVCDLKLSNPDTYRFFVRDAVKRSEFSNSLSFFDETSEIEYLLSKIDCFALTSRLDTMASVAIEAMATGKPIVCFQNTGGIPEMLSDAGFESDCVAEYLDIMSMSEKIVNFQRDDNKSQTIGYELEKLAKRNFDSKRYAAKIAELCKTNSRR